MGSASGDDFRIAELSFLTGPLAGTKSIIHSRSLVGPHPHCDTTLQCDHEIGSVEIFFDRDAWWISNPSTCRVVHNHDVVEGKSQLRSGDIIRLSHDGPDFVFTIGSSVRMATAVPAATPAVSAAGTATTSAAPASSATANAEPVEFAPKKSLVWLWTIPIVASLVVLLAVLSKPGVEEGEFLEVGEQEILEGHRWQLALGDYYKGNSVPAFRLLEPVPAGVRMEDDLLQWEPVVPRDAGTHIVNVEATGRDDQPLATTRIPLFVRMVQRSIQVTSPGELPALAGKPFTYQIVAKVKGHPEQNLMFELDEGVPSGIALNRKSGLVEWVPGKSLVDTTQTIKVSVSGEYATTSNVVFHVAIARGPLTPAEKATQSSYLIAAEEPQTGTLFPFAMASAVRSDSLITTGAIAEELVRVKQKGWKILVQNMQSQEWEDVQDVYVSAAYAASVNEPTEQLYVDIGMLKLLNSSHREVFPLAPRGTVETGMPVKDLAIENEGEPLTKFDHKELLTRPAKVYMLTRLPISKSMDNVESPGLMHLTGKLPDNAYGSPLVDDQYRLLGIYVEKAEIPEDHALAKLRGRYHYAAKVGWLRSWVAGADGDWWVVPKPNERQDPEEGGAKESDQRPPGGEKKVSLGENNHGE